MFPYLSEFATIENAVESRPIIGVMGSGAAPHRERAEVLGRLVARLGAHLLTGGGGGVMAAVSRAFVESPGREGQAIGVFPGDESGAAREGYPNPWVEIPIRTHLPLSGERGEDALSRNHINILSADLVVALPGGPGTASEVRLARRYGKPVVAFVDSAEDILELPQNVPIAETIEQVEAFLVEKM